VFDCSPDDGWYRILDQCTADKRVKGIRLSRNFGQHSAITAGLASARGDWVVVMDCDLQDQPEEIYRLHEHALGGDFDVVFGQRKVRKDSWLKKFLSKAFYRVFSYMTNTAQDPRIANFGIYRRPVITAILSMGDYVRYFPTMAQWVGFRRDVLEVKHSERAAGKSNYNLSRLFRLAFDTILVFSDKPLRLAVQFGMTICLLTLLVSIVYLVRYTLGQITVTGFTSLILSIWFLSGIIVFLLGVVGLYLGKTFDQTKSRPVYIVAATENLDDTSELEVG
jgi:dolichol-phosphate mannosyltransferase